jgi:hypothetical protein
MNSECLSCNKFCILTGFSEIYYSTKELVNVHKLRIIVIYGSNSKIAFVRNQANKKNM